MKKIITKYNFQIAFVLATLFVGVPIYIIGESLFGNEPVSSDVGFGFAMFVIIVWLVVVDKIHKVIIYIVNRGS